MDINRLHDSNLISAVYNDMGIIAIEVVIRQQLNWKGVDTCMTC